jgi:hypothetical protein
MFAQKLALAVLPGRKRKADRERPFLNSGSLDRARLIFVVKRDNRIMSELGAVLEQLKKKRNGLVVELRQLDRAIKALNGLSIPGPNSNGTHRGKRTLSAAARQKIAAAQRARWAKLRGAKRKAA